MLKSNALKVLLVTGLLYTVRFLYLKEAIDRFKELYPKEYQSSFKDPSGTSSYSS